VGVKYPMQVCGHVMAAGKQLQ